MPTERQMAEAYVRSIAEQINTLLQNAAQLNAKVEELRKHHDECLKSLQFSQVPLKPELEETVLQPRTVEAELD